MNEQNNNSNGKVKSKFFNQDLFDDAIVNDVGSSTSGQVICWGVGGNSSTPLDVNNVSVLETTQMFNLVNSDVTDFEGKNAYIEQVNVQPGNGGLFDGSQFAQSMERK